MNGFTESNTVEQIVVDALSNASGANRITAKRCFEQAAREFHPLPAGTRLRAVALQRAGVNRR